MNSTLSYTKNGDYLIPNLKASVFLFTTTFSQKHCHRTWIGENLFR